MGLDYTSFINKNHSTHEFNYIPIVLHLTVVVYHDNATSSVTETSICQICDHSKVDLL